MSKMVHVRPQQPGSLRSSNENEDVVVGHSTDPHVIVKVEGR